MTVLQGSAGEAGDHGVSTRHATARGSLLDLQRRMTSTVCKIAEYFEDSEPLPARNFRQAGKISPPRVLVVDDEPLIRWSVSESLSDLGFDVSSAGDASSALKIVTTTREPFEVIVLDLRLPDMHDLSLLGTVRQLLPQAHLILMTAFGSADVVADARAMGADLLFKPFELDELNRLVIEDRPDPS